MKTLLFIFVAFATTAVLAQEQVAAVEINEDDLGNVSSLFKESFFDALSYKARENYDKAIENLLECERMEPENGAVQFELAKNYVRSNAFAKAEYHLLNAIKIAGEREWLLDTLYEVYNRLNKYELALETLKKLVVINDNYEELLPAAYMRNDNRLEAVAAIELLDKKLGKSDRRTAYKNQLERGLQREKFVNNNLEEFEKQLLTDPKNEQLYIQLIYGYSRLENQGKVLEIAQQLANEIPESDKAHLALYKIYLDNEDVEQGVNSLYRVLGSSQLDDETKVDVLQDFIQLSSNDPDLQPLIKPAIAKFAQEVENVNAYITLGDYFKTQRQLQAALQFYELGMELNDQDFELIKKSALLYLDTGAFEKAAMLSSTALESFPAQPLLYLIYGASLNQTGDYKKAVVQLDTGLSYVIDEPQLEKDLYDQLAISYEKLGDDKKAAAARKRASSVAN